MTDDDIKAPADEPLCSSCGYPLKEYTAGLRHFGTHTAHVEWYCVQRLKGEVERLRLELGQARLCLTCGKTKPATEPAHEPLKGCEPDSEMGHLCSFDATPQEAWQHWSAEAHRLRAEREVMNLQRDSLRDALAKVLDDGDRYAKATMSYQNARENFSDGGAKERKAHERAMLAASDAEREARVLLLTLKDTP